MTTKTTGQEAQHAGQTVITLGSESIAIVDYQKGILVTFTHDVTPQIGKRMMPAAQIVKDGTPVGHLLMLGTDWRRDTAIYIPGDETYRPQLLRIVIDERTGATVFHRLSVEEFGADVYALTADRKQVIPRGLDPLDAATLADSVKAFCARQIKLALEDPESVTQFWKGISIDGRPVLPKTEGVHFVADGDEIDLVDLVDDPHAPQATVMVTDKFRLATNVDVHIIATPHAFVVAEESRGRLDMSVLATDADGQIWTIPAIFKMEDDGLSLETVYGEEAELLHKVNPLISYVLKRLETGGSLDISVTHPMIETGELLILAPKTLDQSIAQLIADPASLRIDPQPADGTEQLSAARAGMPA